MPEHYSGVYRKAARLGFRVTDLFRKLRGVEDCLAYYAEIGAQRERLPFEIDGVVYKVDDLAARERLRLYARAPRWAIAHNLPRRKRPRWWRTSSPRSGAPG